MQAALVEWLGSLPFLAPVDPARYALPSHLVCLLAHLLSDPAAPTTELRLQVACLPLEDAVFESRVSDLLQLAIASPRRAEVIAGIKALQHEDELRRLFKHPGEQMIDHLECLEHEKTALTDELEASRSQARGLAARLTFVGNELEALRARLASYEESGLQEVLELREQRIKELEEQLTRAAVLREEERHLAAEGGREIEARAERLAEALKERERELAESKGLSREAGLLAKVQELDELLLIERKVKSNLLEQIKSQDRENRELKDGKLRQAVEFEQLRLEVRQKTQQVLELEQLVTERQPRSCDSWQMPMPSEMYYSGLEEDEEQCAKEDCIKNREDAGTWMAKCAEMVKIIQSYKDQIAELSKVQAQPEDNKSLKYYEGIVQQRNSTIEGLRDRLKEAKKELQEAREAKDCSSALSQQVRKQENIIEGQRREVNELRRRWEEEAIIMMAVIAQLRQ
jgi:hypothetical protein